MQLHIMELAFDNLKNEEDRDYFNNLPTSFTLKKEEVEALIKVGRKLLIDHPEIKKINWISTNEEP